jgi:hypothetical protein
MHTDHAAQRRTHLSHKPGASPAAQQCSIEPLILGDMLEERHPDLWGMLVWPHLSNGVQQGIHGFLKDLLHQAIFILIMAIEGGSTHHCPLG